MEKLYIILGMVAVLIIGFVKIISTCMKIAKNRDFISDFRNKFIDFANMYFESYDVYSRKSNNFDEELYVWLTMNVNRVQNLLGNYGRMYFVAPFQIYQVPNYEVVINTLPKFRNHSVESFEINSVDDCLLRYLGTLQERLEKLERIIKNPFIWFKTGIQELLSIPLYFLNWFGVFGNKTLSKIIGGLFYRVFTGIIAFVAFLSGIVTIITGWKPTIQFISNIFCK
jgi:hypothetical protein